MDTHFLEKIVGVQTFFSRLSFLTPNCPDAALLEARIQMADAMLTAYEGISRR